MIVITIELIGDKCQTMPYCKKVKIKCMFIIVAPRLNQPAISATSPCGDRTFDHPLGNGISIKKVRFLNLGSCSIILIK